MPINNNCCVNNCCKGRVPDTFQLIFSGVTMCGCTAVPIHDHLSAGYYKVISGSLDGVYCVTKTADAGTNCTFLLTLDTPIVVGRFSPTDSGCVTLLDSVEVQTIRVIFGQPVGPPLTQTSIDIAVFADIGFTHPFGAAIFFGAAESPTNGPFLLCEEGTYDNLLTTCSGSADSSSVNMGTGGTVTVIPDEC